MAKLLQIDFKFEGPFGKVLATELQELAKDIAEEPGLVWKIWTESAERKEAGGIYLFEDEQSASKFLEKHGKRLKKLGIENITAKLSDISEELTEITRGPVKQIA